MSTAVAQEGRFGAAFEWLGVERAWTRTRGSPAVTIGIVDHGVQLDHPLLGPNIQPNSAHRPIGASDLEIAGTHAAGVAAGRSSDIERFSGIAPEARVLPVRFADGETALDCAHAIEYAVEHGACIINLSADGNPALSAVRRAIEYAATRNVLVVCPLTDVHEATCAPDAGVPPNQITVLSIDERCTPLSNYSRPAAHLAAPGFARVPHWRGRGYSMRRDAAIGSAYVSGCAALVKARNPTWGYCELKEHLVASARPLGELVGKCRSGRLLDIEQAVVGPIALIGDRPPAWPSLGDAVLRWKLRYRSAYCTNVVALFRPRGDERWRELGVARAAAGKIAIPGAALSGSSGELRIACQESNFHSDSIEVTLR